MVLLEQRMQDISTSVIYNVKKEPWISVWQTIVFPVRVHF